MKKEQFIKDVIVNAVKMASSDSQVLILNGHQLYQLEEYQSLHLANMMKEVSDTVVKGIIDSMGSSKEFTDSDPLLSRAFMFYFDKCLEIVYNMRVENEKGVDFNFEELFNGISGDQIPEYIQVKVNKIVGSIISIYQKTFHYIQSLECTNIELEDKIRTTLYCSIQIGMQYALELDLNDDSEFQEYLLS